MVNPSPAACENPVLSFAGETVRGLAPYQPGRPIEEVAAERGISDVVKLASNENPLGPSPAALQALRELPAESVSRYPDGNCGKLRQAVAQQLQVAPDNLIFGNGSNEILELAAQLVLTENSAAVMSRHAFIVYQLATAARRARAVIVPPGADFSHDLTAMAACVRKENARMVFIANPNNPTGSWHPPEAIETFMEQTPPEVLVVLDEAYREYLDGKDALTVRRYPNLLIARTFSKIHGLAGLRIGFGVADPELINMLNRIRQPFNSGAAAQAAALAAMADVAHIRRSVEMNARGMKKIADGLDQLQMAHLPSRANFITFHAGAHAAQIYDKLLDAGVIVRPLGGYEMPEWLRVSIGSEEENDRFLRELARIASAVK